jgi:mannose-6-phosphate isomerase-like protein (cupin superfamily)
MEVQQTKNSSGEEIIIYPDAERIKAGPMELLVIEDGTHTSGSHAVLEFTLNGQFSPPPHVHHQHEEVIYVLEGEMALPLRDRTVRLGPGAAFVTPIGLAHTFSNGGSGTLRFLLTISPASHLAYFLEMAEVLQGTPDPQTMMTVMRKYGLEPINQAG